MEVITERRVLKRVCFQTTIIFSIGDSNVLINRAHPEACEYKGDLVTFVQIVLQEGNGDGSGKGELLALTGLGTQMKLWDGDYGRCQLRCNELQLGIGSGVA